MFLLTNKEGVGEDLFSFSHKHISKMKNLNLGMSTAAELVIVYRVSPKTVLVARTSVLDQYL